MAKLVLNDVTTGLGGHTAINANNDATEVAMEKTLSRDGTEPNQMLDNLDMNSFSILNCANIDFQSTHQYENEGVPTGAEGSVAVVDFVGNGVNATQVGADLTVTITQPTSFVDVQTFTAGGSWAKPTGAKIVEFFMVGGGGGGGGGRFSNDGTAVSGGGGGSGAGRSKYRYLGTDLPASLTVIVGAGGAGGVGRDTTGTGFSGSDGTESYMQDVGKNWGGADGGKGGAGGSTTAGLGGQANSQGNIGIPSTTGGGPGQASSPIALDGVDGNDGITLSGRSTSGDYFELISGAGGGGGGVASSGGGSGVSTGSPRCIPWAARFESGLYAFVHNSIIAGTEGTAGVNYFGAMGAGTGGGGGTGSITTVGMAGGAGGLYGAGGGGGGGARSPATTSGAGGAGANGVVVVTSWL